MLPSPPEEVSSKDINSKKHIHATHISLIGIYVYLIRYPSLLLQVNTQIFLYTRRNRNNPDIIPYNSIKNISGIIQLTKFNISAPLKVIIHGFGSSCQRVWPSEMRLALLTVVGNIIFKHAKLLPFISFNSFQRNHEAPAIWYFKPS